MTNIHRIMVMAFLVWRNNLTCSWAADITVRVVDEQNKPSTGMDYEMAIRREYGANDNIVITGAVPRDGVFHTNLLTGAGGIFTTHGTNWYEANVLLNVTLDQHGTSAAEIIEESITARKIINPVPMYAVKLMTWTLPVLDEPVGFDMTKSDWVAPHGTGVTAHVNFKAYMEYYRSQKDCKMILKVSVPHEGGGIMKTPAFVTSNFKSVRAASEDGYQATLTLFDQRIPDGPDLSTENTYIAHTIFYYIIKTRSADGKVCYAKIPNWLEFYVNQEKGTCWMRFSYYFNPDGTRNLECDYKRNLLVEENPELAKPRSGFYQVDMP